MRRAANRRVLRNGRVRGNGRMRRQSRDARFRQGLGRRKRGVMQWDGAGKGRANVAIGGKLERATVYVA